MQGTLSTTPTRLIQPGLIPMVSPHFGKAAPAETAVFSQVDFSNLKMKMPPAMDELTLSSGGKTKIETLIGGGQIFRKIEEMLNKADQSVYLNLYNFQNPRLYPDDASPTGTPGSFVQSGLSKKLVELADQGKDVKVILDNHSDSKRAENYNDKMIRHLRRSKVDVKVYPRSISVINHVKAIIVDNKYAVVSGMNWGNHSATNHDAGVYIEGPDVKNIVNDIFRNNWITSGGKESDIEEQKAVKNPQLKVLLTASRESQSGARDDIYRELMTQISSAKDSIYAELFVLTQQDIIDNLIEKHRELRANGKEGVKILVDPGLFFALPNTRKGVHKLARHGIPIRFYSSDRSSDEKLHAKWAVFDEKKLVVGSANWSNVGLLSNRKTQEKSDPMNRRVSRGNHEMALSIDSAEIAAPFVQQALYDWHNRSFPILESTDDGKWKPVNPSLKNAELKAKAIQQRLDLDA